MTVECSGEGANRTARADLWEGDGYNARNELMSLAEEAKQVSEADWALAGVEVWKRRGEASRNDRGPMKGIVDSCQSLCI